MRKLGLTLCALSLGAISAGAANIITVASNGSGPGNGNIVSNTAFAMSWTQSGTFTNVQIQAAIGANLPQGSLLPEVDAYLTTSLGAGASGGSQATVSVPLSGDPHPLLTLFSGLTLGPGTYYLSVFHRSGGSPDWNFQPSPTVTTDVGSTATGLYRATSPFAGFAPASDFTLQTFGAGFFSVTGDPDTNVPEPVSMVLVGAGLGAIVLRRRLV